MIRWLANKLSGGELDFAKELRRRNANQEQTIHELYTHIEQAEMSRDAYRQVVGELRHDVAQLANARKVDGDVIATAVAQVHEVDRSRSGWKWLYEQKCRELEALRKERG